MTASFRVKQPTCEEFDLIRSVGRHLDVHRYHCVSVFVSVLVEVGHYARALYDYSMELLPGLPSMIAWFFHLVSQVSYITRFPVTVYS